LGITVIKHGRVRPSDVINPANCFVDSFRGQLFLAEDGGKTPTSDKYSPTEERIA